MVWEYLEIRARFSGSIVSVNGMSVDEHYGSDWSTVGRYLFLEYANYLGSQGWELVGITQVDSSRMGTEVAFVYVFKRQLSREVDC